MYADFNPEDEFAQTRPPDDLFDDDFTPMPEPVVEPSPVVEASPVVSAPNPPPNAPHGPRDQGQRGRGRGRGRGNRGHGRGGRGEHQGGREHQTQGGGGSMQASAHAPAAHAPPVEKEELEKPVVAKKVANGEAEAEGEGDGAKAALHQTPAREGAVRGDRSGTGGVKRTKLTEAELSARLASISLKNSLRTAAHARAEADLASFEAREAQAAHHNAEKRKQLQQRQKADRQNRAQMMGERERNAQRKLQAMGGREWDLEKEEGFGGTGEEKRGAARRGAFGGVVGGVPAAREEGAGEEEAPSTPSHRGGERGGRGRGRGRGGRGGRGDAANSTPHAAHTPKAQKPPGAEDFPDLPVKEKKAEDQAEDKPKILDFPIKGKATKLDTSVVAETKESKETVASPRPGQLKQQESFGLPSPAAGRSWADQVEGAS
ncbi:uncharacterized protein BDZ99DRAFT_207791 [Mytilinidion resinicola]|uniref:Uncharacterized protein n=1 Tax=Mytilinidion resinicola TaxID=574789 RepID=A0A6A6Y0E8_9PEZI|nr:uncharacterized protein BDZ99DRAFT_207791 [Mytilinidion resinicola]KAF2802296.1 hypothetical protein BDZ99DRAFT_207791 [Mytilinidion resinicola]